MSLTELVVALHKAGVFNTEYYGPVRAHQDFPDAPLSPFYVNLRTEAHPKKPGPVTQELVVQIAYQLALLMDEEYPAKPPGRICGLPDAGLPFVEMISQMRSLEIQPLAKEQLEDGIRRIVPPPKSEWPELTRQTTLACFDDVVTRADTKIEGATAGRAMGYLVRHVFVFCDRSNGGAADALAAHDLIMRAVLNDHKLFSILADAGVISEAKATECVNYKHALEAHILDTRRSLDSSSGD
ncbi:hypothetical protein KJ910_01560 [Patescibacteria group bacterium]|nr:hypothetical protein [Patescibacteria group bacterium]MBU1907254.1 hypothetical protein [Patescibacteria group bacterium]